MMTQKQIIEAQQTGEIFVMLYSQWEKVQGKSYTNEMSNALRMIHALELIKES